jgi:3-phosphoshikimate 1-carboxyvinyltransferase
MLNLPYIDIPPLLCAAGSVRLPGSKSISNRVLLLAGLSSGTTRIHDVLYSDDTRVMLQALQQLGCTIDNQGTQLVITGLGGQPKVRRAELFLGNAGTAMRPLAAALALIASRSSATESAYEYQLSGIQRMHERPIGDLIGALQQLGCAVEYAQNSGYPPIRIKSSEKPLQLNVPIRVRGDVSSQFLTALLLSLPLVTEYQDAIVEVEGELISKPYVEITLNLLHRFGVAVEREGWHRFKVPCASAYHSPGHIHIEGDASSASYFIAAATIGAQSAPLRIEGIGKHSIQGDLRFVDAARAMGAKIYMEEGYIEVRRGEFPLKAIELDCNSIPDAAMTLAVMALFADGTTRLSNIGSWRVKETDRIHAMSTELRKLGAEVESGADFLTVTPPQKWCSAMIDTYDDHRMAMCFSLAAFNPLITQAPCWIRLHDPDCVGKTFPDYFETFFNMMSSNETFIPVITVDGPTASGKGTVASRLAQALGYHWLDSGVVYRATALSALRRKINLDDETAIIEVARQLELRFTNDRIFVDNQDVTEVVHTEKTGGLASQISAFAGVRQALKQLQLSFQKVPGLVADGRDMGTALFPNAELKIYLTASVEKRAERRLEQLISKGFQANIFDLRADLEARDARDKNRSASPLKPAEDALLLDNSFLTIEETVSFVLLQWEQRQSRKLCNPMVAFVE